MRRLLEEFPSAVNGLARSERQILEVLAEGPRTPEQTFVAAARFEEAIYMGDLSFWDIVKRLSGGPHPLLTLDVQERPGRLPDGHACGSPHTGRAVLAGRADHVALNGISRWLGGTLLTPERLVALDGFFFAATIALIFARRRTTRFRLIWCRDLSPFNLRHQQILPFGNSEIWNFGKCGNLTVFNAQR